MKFLFVFPLLYPLLLAGVANAERKLPTNLQVDLLFPRNETYAPTQQFPIVFGLNNLDAVWPLEILLSVEVRSTGMLGSSNKPSWATKYASFYYSDFQAAFGQAPRKQFFHFPATNMTNGTTDSYIVSWDIVIPRQCFINGTESEESRGGVAWSDNPKPLKYRTVEFSTAPGAQLPDIEATANSCPERNGNNSAAIRITDVMTTSYTEETCPVIGATIKPEKCVFKSAANELTANVSAAMLHDMRCDEGDWRTITAPCPREKSTALRQSAGCGVGLLVLTLAFAISNGF